MKFVNKSFPVEKLREETLAFTRKLEVKSPFAVRYTKECIRSVRRMTKDQAYDYLNCKSDALKHVDPEGGRQKAMTQFLDEKTFKPGLGDYKR
jgi:trans-feruloyl-CoA hydratase/vanillin synthase